MHKDLPHLSELGSIKLHLVKPQLVLILSWIMFLNIAINAATLRSLSKTRTLSNLNRFETSAARHISKPFSSNSFSCIIYCWCISWFMGTLDIWSRYVLNSDYNKDSYDYQAVFSGNAVQISHLVRFCV